LWLDYGEFDALVARRFTGHEAERDLNKHMFVKASRVAHCPVDHGPLVGVQFEALELEYCPQCRGVWIDGADRAALAAKSAEHPFDEAQVKLPRAGGGNHPVTCSGCGVEVPERTTLHVGSKYFCESCVVNGDFPELEAHVQLMTRGHRVRTNKERHEIHHTQSSHLPTAVQTTVDYLKHLFD
jgi:Zn-finger nucleic acid-binding protein